MTEAGSALSRTESGVSARLLDWFDRHGRHGLPWQQDPTPYRIWVSEVMLQQTQVASVRAYFERFVKRFPDLRSLAGAELDEVLHLWSGLGYYARGRNLHRAAGLVCARHGGELPRDHPALCSLPGIGRSTAGAILAIAHGQRHAILDGNVKRVLARYHAVEGWPGNAAVSRELWALAERHTPGQRVAEYTQAIMDLGATVCVRGEPLCAVCPLQDHCEAHQSRRTRHFPGTRARRPLPVKRTVLVVLQATDGAVLLEKRPPTGVWGGLWSLPECPPDSDVARWCEARHGYRAHQVRALPARRHTFSHFHLDFQAVLLRVDPQPRSGDGVDAHRAGDRVMEGAETLWYNTRAATPVGLAAPIAELLGALE